MATISISGMYAEGGPVVSAELGGVSLLTDRPDTIINKSNYTNQFKVA